MASKALAPGVRFHPTDVELVKYYLQKKVTGKRIRFDVISEVDVYKFSPSDLPDKSQLKSTDLEWFFFCPRERKFANGERMNRATEYGYWKTTGRDRLIKFNDRTVGMIKTLIYHEGKAPHGKRTDWVMHEYRLKDEDLANSEINQDAYVICKIFLKSGPGPRPTQHLFNEDDWSDDGDNDTSLINFPLADSSFLNAMNMHHPGCSTVANLCNPAGISTDASTQANHLKSIEVLKEGDNESLSLLELANSPNEIPNTPKELPNSLKEMVTVQKDVSVSELPQVSNSHVFGIQNNYNCPSQCQKGIHGNTCLMYEGHPHNAIFSAGEMLSEGSWMLASRSLQTEVGYLDNIDTRGLVEGLDSFFDPGVQSGYEESFIELDDFNNPLDNELDWSHLIPTDGLLNEVDQHSSEVPPFLSVDDYRGSSCNDAPVESVLLPGSSLRFSSCTHTPQKDDASDIGNNLSIYSENWRQWEG